MELYPPVRTLQPRGSEAIKRIKKQVIGVATKRSKERKTRRTPSVSARNTIKNSARLGKETRKLASGAKASMLGPHQERHTPFQLRVAPDIPPPHMLAEVVIPPLRAAILTSIASLAIWIWVEIEIMGGWDVHKSTVAVKLVATDPAVPIIPMERPGPTTAI